MKYAQMEAALKADAYAKASGTKAPDEPALTEAEVARRNPPPRSGPVPFALFRASSPASPAPYIGSVICPDGRILHIEAHAIPERIHQHGDGTTTTIRPHFEGNVYSADMLAKRDPSFRKLADEVNAAQKSLELIEPPPFNDSLEGIA